MEEEIDTLTEEGLEEIADWCNKNKMNPITITDKDYYVFSDAGKTIKKFAKILGEIKGECEKGNLPTKTINDENYYELVIDGATMFFRMHGDANHNGEK